MVQCKKAMLCNFNYEAVTELVVLLQYVEPILQCILCKATVTL